MTAIVVVGGGGHARVVAGVLKRLTATLKPIGYTDKEDHGLLLDLPYLGTDDALSKLMDIHGRIAAAIGIGYIRSTTIRRRVQGRLAHLGIPMPAIVSQHALIAEGVEIGEGVQVLDRATVSPGAILGTCAILNTGCIVEHDVRVGEFAHLASGATVAGGVHIGRDVLIGANATVIQGLSIADGCIVGAGAVVTRDLDRLGVYVGAPAKRVA